MNPLFVEEYDLRSCLEVMWLQGAFELLAHTAAKRVSLSGLELL